MSRFVLSVAHPHDPLFSLTHDFAARIFREKLHMSYDPSAAAFSVAACDDAIVATIGHCPMSMNPISGFEAAIGDWPSLLPTRERCTELDWLTADHAIMQYPALDALVCAIIAAALLDATRSGFRCATFLSGARVERFERMLDVPIVDFGPANAEGLGMRIPGDWSRFLQKQPRCMAVPLDKAEAPLRSALRRHTKRCALVAHNATLS